MNFPYFDIWWSPFLKRTGTSGVDNEHMSQKFCGPSPSQINSADLLPDEQKRVATVEDEEQSM